MSWIATISPEQAQGRLKVLYDRLAGPNGQVDHVLQIHSLRPHTLEGHMSLYKSVLHHPGNKLPKWFMEAIGTYVSHLNACSYCVDHHLAGMRRMLGDERRSDTIQEALRRNEPGLAFEGAQLRLLEYARLLTLEPARISQSLIEQLRAAGVEDGELLEVNQVVAYFCYANRTVLGLGVTTQGEVLGLSPSRVGDHDWQHG